MLPRGKNTTRRKGESKGASGASDAASICGPVEAWFKVAARELPWRLAAEDAAATGWRRDPYRALVSEAMLQQTQVLRVVDRFAAFVDRFPTVHTLASASEHDVLAMWSGLGYYRRARSLHAAAKVIVEQHGGCVPRGVSQLETLPGIGRYTAGAIASMAGAERVALVDGNVVRVLLRVEGRDGNAGEKETMTWTWERAGKLVKSADDAGVFNEGMMELGAVVCTPRRPKCAECPLRKRCRARAAGTEEAIPSAKKRTAKSTVYCSSIVVQDSTGNVLLEQRGAAGMWAGMWQVPTLENRDALATGILVRAYVRECVDKSTGRAVPKLVSTFVHETTHRQMVFDVWRVSVRGIMKGETGTNNRRDAYSTGGREWMTIDEAMAMPISNAQRRVLMNGLKNDTQASASRLMWGDRETKRVT